MSKKKCRGEKGKKWARRFTWHYFFFFFQNLGLSRMLSRYPEDWQSLIIWNPHGEGQRTTCGCRFCPSTMLVPGIGLISLGSGASVFTHWDTSVVLLLYFKYVVRKKMCQEVVASAFNTSTWGWGRGQRQEDFCEFEASLVYSASSRTSQGCTDRAYVKGKKKKNLRKQPEWKSSFV